MRGGFHIKNGLYFRKAATGEIEIQMPGAKPIAITVEEFASVVAAMSKRGENGATYAGALYFLKKEGPDLPPPEPIPGL